MATLGLAAQDTPFCREVPTLEVASRLGLCDWASLAVASSSVAAAFRSAYLPPKPACSAVACREWEQQSPSSEKAFAQAALSLTMPPADGGGEVMDLVCCVLAIAMCNGEVTLDRLGRPDGKSVLTVAAAAGRPDVVRWLLDAPGAAALVNLPDANGASALHYAALSGHDHVCEVLIAGGADVEASDCTGLRPLHLAAESGHLSSVQALVDGGAEVNARDEDSVTPLLLAAQENNIEVCSFLVSKRADPLASSIQGRTPMTVARETGADGLLGALEAALWPGARKRSRLVQTPETLEIMKRAMALR